MEVGQQNNSVACIIQARMSSSRLPGKSLIPIPISGGKPMLLWIVEELRKSKYQPTIIVATSLNKENDSLEEFCANQGVYCFRGDENDVLSRFVEIVKDKNPSTVVRLTADNPLIDIKVLDETIERHLENENDYTKTENLPLGMNFEVVASSAILETTTAELSKADKEHVTLFIRNSSSSKKEIYHPAISGYLKELRLTVDYPSDLLLASTVLSFALKNDDIKGLALVEKVYVDYPWLFEVNALNIQKRQFVTLEEELVAAEEVLKNLEYHKAASILKRHEKKDSI